MANEIVMYIKEERDYDFNGVPSDRNIFRLIMETDGMEYGMYSGVSFEDAKEFALKLQSKKMFLEHCKNYLSDIQLEEIQEVLPLVSGFELCYRDIVFTE